MSYDADVYTERLGATPHQFETIVDSMSPQVRQNSVPLMRLDMIKSALRRNGHPVLTRKYRHEGAMYLVQTIGLPAFVIAEVLRTGMRMFGGYLLESERLQEELCGSISVLSADAVCDTPHGQQLESDLWEEEP